MVTRASFHNDSAGGETAPAHLMIKRTDEGMAARAKQHDAAGISARLILEPGVDVGAPELTLVLGARREINKILYIHAILELARKEGFNSFADPGGAPFKKIARFGSTPANLMLETETKIPKGFGQESGCPAQAGVAGIVGPA